MEHPEHITDEIRAFLNGRLDEEQAAAFRQRMANDPALEDQVAFARLMLNGLALLVQRKQRRRKQLLFGGMLLLVLVCTGIWYCWRDWQEGQQHPVPEITRQANQQSTRNAIRQGGGQSPKRESERATSVAWNHFGEVILAGQFLDSTLLGPFALPGSDNFDIFLASCTPSAGFQWARRFGSAKGNDYVIKIALDSKDNILMTGGFYDQAVFEGNLLRAKGSANAGEGDFFIAKLNPAGQLRWIDHAGGNMVPNKQTGNNLGMSVTTDRQDNVIATGAYLGTPEWGGQLLPVGGPNEDLYLVKYNASGKMKWVKTVTCDYQIVPRGVATDRQGNIYVTGIFGHHNAGGKAYFGSVVLTSFGGRDMFVAKFSPEGQLLWAQQAGSAEQGGRDSGNSIAVDEQGNAVITGFFEGSTRFGKETLRSHGGRDIFIASYSPEGEVQWVRSLGGVGNDQGSAICVDQAGNSYCTGRFEGEVRFETLLKSLGKEDIFIVKYSPDGRLLWVRQTGGDAVAWNSDGAHDISIDPDGGLVVTGFFSGTMHIGHQTLISGGQEDIFVLFFDREGKLLEARRFIYAL